jgi:hypothetical protein
MKTAKALRITVPPSQLGRREINRMSSAFEHNDLRKATGVSGGEVSFARRTVQESCQEANETTSDHQMTAPVSMALSSAGSCRPTPAVAVPPSTPSICHAYGSEPVTLCSPWPNSSCSSLVPLMLAQARGAQGALVS